MRVYLVRHGEAEPATAARGDAGRALTKHGAAEVKAVARGLRALGAEPERLLTSPLRRAVETAALLARGLDGPEPEPWPELGAGAVPEAVLRGLAGAGDCIALVGHQPTLGQVVTLAIAGVAASGAALGKASVACVDFEGQPRPGSGRLRWMLRADQLRRLG